MRYLQKLYVSLSALMDLRLGALNLVSPEFAYLVSTQDGYFTREQDTFSSEEIEQKSQKPFGTIDAALIYEIADKHPQAVLKASLKTCIDKFIKQLCATHMQSLIRQGMEVGVEVDVNIWPFKMTQEEKNVLAHVLSDRLGNLFSITVIDTPEAQVKPEEVRENYFGMVLYRYETWVNMHQAELSKKPLRDTCLYVPRLFFGDLQAAREEIDKLQQKKMDVFNLWRQALAPFLPVQYLPIAFYSADIPQNKPEYTNPL